MRTEYDTKMLPTEYKIKRGTKIFSSAETSFLPVLSSTARQKLQ